MLMRFFFYGLNVKRCRGILIFMALQYLLAFMILHANVETMYTIYAKMNYVSPNDNGDVYWLNGVVSSFVECDNRNDFYDFVSEIEGHAGIEKVGYAREGSAVLEGEEYGTPLFVVNEVYGAWAYQLSEGSWFDFQQDETQFILGGYARKNYCVGDTITIQVPVQDEQQKITYRSCSGVVIGFLPEQAYAIDLNYAASEPEFGDMLMQYPALILTNDESIAEGQNWSYPNVSLLVKIAEEKRESAISFLSQYGDCISFSEIQKNSLNGFWDEFWQMLFPNIAMMLAVIYGIAGITFLFIHRSRQALAVYEMCGQSAADRRTFILFTNGFPMAVGVMMSFVLSCLKAVKASFYIENIWTIYHVVSTVLLALVFLLVMCFCTNTMLRHTTIANMRRSE